MLLLWKDWARVLETPGVVCIILSCWSCDTEDHVLSFSFGKHVDKPVILTSLSDQDNLTEASYDRILWQIIFPQPDDLDSVGLLFYTDRDRDSWFKIIILQQYQFSSQNHNGRKYVLY